MMIIINFLFNSDLFFLFWRCQLTLAKPQFLLKVLLHYCVKLLHSYSDILDVSSLSHCSLLNESTCCAAHIDCECVRAYLRDEGDNTGNQIITLENLLILRVYLWIKHICTRIYGYVFVVVLCDVYASEIDLCQMMFLIRKLQNIFFRI